MNEFPTLADMYEKLSDERYAFRLDKVFNNAEFPVRVVVTERASGRTEQRPIRAPDKHLSRREVVEVLSSAVREARDECVAALENQS